MTFYPVNLNITGRLCLVVGGGSVAARKIHTLLSSGAQVRVVSPVACGKITDFAKQGRVEWLVREYREADMHGAFMVFAATDQPLVQKRLAAQAKRENVLLNSADMPDTCDFQIPAKISRGDLLITVSTGGGSPALSTLIKKSLLLEFGPEYGILVTLMRKIRYQIVASNSESGHNKQLFHTVLALPVLEYIKEKRWEELQDHLAAVLPDTINTELLVGELRGELLC